MASNANKKTSFDVTRNIFWFKRSGLPQAAVANILQRIWPEPFASPAGDVSGLNVAVIIIRQLLSFLPQDDEEEDAPGDTAPAGGHGGDTGADSAATQVPVQRAWHMRRMNNRLLGYCKVNLPVLNELNEHVQFVGSTSLRKAVLRCQVKALRRIESDGIAPGGSFMDIMEGGTMLEQLWAHWALYLYSPEMWYRHSSQPDGAWASRDDGQPAKRRAQESLVRWDGSGGSLGEFLTGLFGVWTHPKLHVLRSPNMPTFLRVLYTPPAEGGPGFEQLRILRYRGQYCSMWPEGELQGQSEMRMTDPERYHLVASVRLREGDEADLVRTYTAQGAYIRSPLAAERSLNYVSDDWRIGQPGHSYMLYFVKSIWPYLDGPEVVVLTDAERHVDQLVRQMHALAPEAPPLATWEEYQEGKRPASAGDRGSVGLQQSADSRRSSLPDGSRPAAGPAFQPPPPPGPTGPPVRAPLPPTGPRRLPVRPLQRRRRDRSGRRGRGSRRGRGA